MYSQNHVTYYLKVRLKACGFWILSLQRHLQKCQNFPPTWSAYFLSREAILYTVIYTVASQNKVTMPIIRGTRWPRKVLIPGQKWFENKFITALIEFLAQCNISIPLRNKHLRWHVDNEFILLSESLNREHVTGYCYCSRNFFNLLYKIKGLTEIVN